MGAEASGDFLLDLAHAQVALGAIVGKRDVGVLGEAQHGGLVLFHSLPQIVGIGLGHFATLTLLSRGNRWKLFLPLGEDGAVAFLYGLVLAFGKRFLVALSDLVAGVEEQAFHALGPGVVVGVDDEGEFAQQVRATQGVVAVRVAQVRGPAVVDRDTAVARDDADGLDGFAPALGVEAFDGERSGGIDMNPVILSVHAQRGLVDVHRRLCQEALDGVVFPLGEGVVELGDVAEQRRLGQELADEGVHRLSDALEREHLGDEQVHDVGLDAGAVLQRAGHLVGEARAGLGVAARAVLDVGVGVTHDLLEHDVDEGAPLVTGAGGVR